MMVLTTFGALLASFLVVLERSWRLFGCSWGVLGSSRWLPSYFNNHSGALLSHQSGPQSVVKGPQEPSKRARWPQDAIKIHAKTSSKQFSHDFVTFRFSNTQIYVQTRRAVRFVRLLFCNEGLYGFYELICFAKTITS